MKHDYVMSDDLNEIQEAHDELVQNGVPDEHIHVLSDDEASLDKRHLRPVNPFMKTDVVRATSYGAIIGALLSLAVLSIPFLFGVTTPAGSVPFVFAAIMILGFSTWEGGLWGIQSANKKFEKIDENIHRGKHMMIVDYDDAQEISVEEVKKHHPKLQAVSL